MNVYKFTSATPFTHNMSGKFEAPNAEWMHLTRQLFDFELIIVTDGILYIADHDRCFTVNKGEYLLMRPTENQHGYKSSNCSFYWIHFYSTMQYETVNSDSQNSEPDSISITIPEYGTLESLERIVVLMKQLQDSDRRYGMNCLNNYITSAILSEISAQYFIHSKYTATDNSNQLFNDIMDYINWHICENLKVTDIAEYFGYNEKYLSTLFRKNSSTSLKQYILQAKMDHAKAELSDTNHSVSQIGYNIGYNDPHNFTNAFKKVTGLTPSEYRESYSKRKLYYK